MREDYQWSFDFLESTVIGREDEVESGHGRLFPGNQADVEFGEEMVEAGDEWVGGFDREGDLDAEVGGEYRQQVEQAVERDGVVHDDEDLFRVADRGPLVGSGTDGDLTWRPFGHVSRPPLSLACADAAPAQHRRRTGEAPSILVFPFPAHGHVNPLLPLIAELVGLGVLVEVVVSATFAQRFVDCGAVVWPAAFETVAAVPERAGVGWAVRHGRELVRRRRWGWELARGWRPAELPGLVLADPMATWGRAWARRCGVAMVALHTTWVRRPGRAPALIAVLPELQPGRLGAGQACVGPLLRQVRRDGGLPWERIEAGPTVLVSPGTVYARGPRFFAAVAEAFAGTEWLVVMATGGTEPGALPGNVIARPQLPQPAVLEHAAAFVTHAGMNSVQEALARAVPMVFVPRSREQRGTADRLTALGAGVRVGGRTPRPEELFAAVTQVSADPRVRSTLTWLRERVEVEASAGRAGRMVLRFASKSG